MNRALFSNYRAEITQVVIAGGTVKSQGTGTVFLDLICRNGDVRTFQLTNVLYIQELPYNLFSAIVIKKHGMYVNGKTETICFINSGREAASYEVIDDQPFLRVRTKYIDSYALLNTAKVSTKT